MFQMFTRCPISIINHRLFSTKSISIKNDLIKNLREKIDNEKSYVNVSVENFIKLYGNDDEKRKIIEKIITIYDEMKYNLEPVPSSLTQNDVESLSNLIRQSSIHDLRREIRKLHRKELNQLVKKELKQLHFDADNKNNVHANGGERSGLFDSQGQLIYGLWHNTLFTRISMNPRRLSLDKFRRSYLFGQNLFIDCSYSSYLSRHQSIQLANDLFHMIHYNQRQIIEPFKIILCGVDYNHYIWKTLKQLLPNLDEIIEHTDRKLLSFPLNPNELVYFTSIEKSTSSMDPLTYNPYWSYVLPAIPERLLNRDFLTPSLQKMKLRRMCVPIDSYVLWKTGSKRLSMQQKIKFLNDIRSDNFDWKKSILNHMLNKQQQ